MTIKATYLVTDMDLNPDYDNAMQMNVEHKTEKAALAAAKRMLNGSEDDEVWIWRLSHIVSKPAVEPDVEIVK